MMPTFMGGLLSRESHPQLGALADLLFEPGGRVGGDAAHVRVAVAGEPREGQALVDDPPAAVGFGVGAHGDDGGAGAEVHHADGRDRRRGAPEERHEDPGPAGVLVDHHGDADAARERLDDRAHRILLRDDLVAGSLAHAGEGALEPGVFHRLRDHEHRQAEEALHVGDELPVSEVARDDEHAAPLGVRGLHRFEVLVADPRADLLAPASREGGAVGGDAPVVAPAIAHDAPPVVVRQRVAEGDLQVLLRDPGVLAIQAEGERAHRAAQARQGAFREGAGEREQRGRGRRFDRKTHALADGR
jgi:hypothetical protein